MGMPPATFAFFLGPLLLSSSQEIKVAAAQYALDDYRKTAQSIYSQAGPFASRCWDHAVCRSVLTPVEDVGVMLG